MHSPLSSENKRKWILDIPLAGWILSAVTFLTGTIVTPLHDRLTHNGIAIGQPYETGGVAVGSNYEMNTTSYVVVLKISNANKTALIIEDVTSPDQRGTNINFQFIGAKVTALREPMTFPPKASLTDSKSYLPILVPSESSELFAVELVFRNHDPQKTNLSVREIATIFDKSGIPISMRVNGKLVSYSLRSQRFPHNIPVTGTYETPAQPSVRPRSLRSLDAAR